MRQPALATLILLGLTPTAWSTSFDLSTLDSNARTLSDNETGTIRVGGSLIVSTGNAIDASGNSVTINNAGVITTSATSSHSINSSGSEATITNSGYITNTASSGGFGIYVSGSNGTVSNSGTISLTGSSGAAIYSSTGSTINNSGTLNTYGQRAYGIATSGDEAVINNTGTITTTGAQSAGINASGDSTVVTNSGTITTTGDIGSGNSAYGISVSGSNVTVTNNGLIQTYGSSGTGIYASGSSATVINNGTIKANASDAYGILATGSSASISNGGTIETSDIAAHGIYASGSSASISNSGTIRTTGSSAYSVYVIGANSVISNSGTISATGSSSYAVRGNSNAQTLNLYNGSRIYGAIDLGGGGDVVNVYGSGGSATLTLSNVSTLNVYSNNALAVGTSKVVVVDPTATSSSGAMLGLTTLGIHHVIDQRGAGLTGMKTAQLASADDSTDAIPRERRPVLWMQLLGGSGHRDAEGSVAAYRYGYYGFVAGYEHEQASGSRMGWAAGVTTGDVSSNYQKTTSDSIFGGAYSQHILQERFKLGTSLIFGVGSHSNRRDVLDNVSGTQTAQGTNASYYLSPALSLSAAYDLPLGWQLRPGAQVAYSYGYYGGYSESGTSNSNLTIGGHDVQALLSRAQIEGARKLSDGEVSARAGWQSRQVSGGNVSMSIDGYSLSMSAAGSQNVAGPYVGLGMSYRIKQHFNLLGDIEVAQFAGGESLTSGRVTLQYLF